MMGGPLVDTKLPGLSNVSGMLSCAEVFLIAGKGVGMPENRVAPAKVGSGPFER